MTNTLEFTPQPIPPLEGIEDAVLANELYGRHSVVEAINGVIKLTHEFQIGDDIRSIRERVGAWFKEGYVTSIDQVKVKPTINGELAPITD